MDRFGFLGGRGFVCLAGRIGQNTHGEDIFLVLTGAETGTDFGAATGAGAGSFAGGGGG